MSHTQTTAWGVGQTVWWSEGRKDWKKLRSHTDAWGLAGELGLS